MMVSVMTKLEEHYLIWRWRSYWGNWSGYTYVGRKRNLIGHTAHGLYKNGNFYVQVDDLRHRFSHGRWQQNPLDWELTRD